MNVRPRNGTKYHLGYGRVGSGWGLLTRRSCFHADPSMIALPASRWRYTDEKPLQRSSRELRVKAVAAIPDLLKQLEGEAVSVLKTVESPQHLAGTTFEFGETVASNAFWDRHPKFFSATTGKRVQGHGRARHQGVEEMPQRRPRPIPGGIRSGQVLDEAPGEAPGVTWQSSMGAGAGTRHVHIIGRDHTMERSHTIER